MSAFFLDSSALVKRYVQEAGTAWVRQRTGPEADHDPYVALIAGAEGVAALMRQQRTGALDSEDAAAALAAFRREFAGLYHVVAINGPVIEKAMGLAEAHPLRGYDAVQLATALHVQRWRAVVGLDPLTFVSADTTLNAAADGEGLAVEDPNQHD